MAPKGGNKKRKVESLDNGDIVHDLILEHGEIIVESGLRNSGTNNRPFFSMDRILTDIKGLKLINCTIPLTYYNINNTNNKFSYEEDTGGSKELTLVNGAYTSTTLSTHLKSLLDTDSDGGDTYTVTVDTTSFKMTIASTGTFQVYVSISSCITGFSVASGSGTSHIGTDVINLTYIRHLYLHGDFGNYIGAASTITSNTVNNNVIATIPVGETLGNIVNYTYHNAEYFDCNFEQQEYELYFTDENNNLIDFNGGKWVVKFQYQHVIQRK